MRQTCSWHSVAPSCAHSHRTMAAAPAAVHVVHVATCGCPPTVHLGASFLPSFAPLCRLGCSLTQPHLHPPCNLVFEACVRVRGEAVVQFGAGSSSVSGGGMDVIRVFVLACYHRPVHSTDAIKRSHATHTRPSSLMTSRWNVTQR